MWLLVAFCVLLISLAAVGTVVLLRGGKSKINSSFAFFAYSISLWMFFNFMGANFKSHDFSVYATRLDFVFGGIVVFAVWNLSASFLMEADRTKKYRRHYGRAARISALVLSLSSSLLSLFPSVINVSKQHGQDLEVHYGNLYFLFAVCLLLVLGSVVVNFYLTIKKAKGRLRQQVSLMLAALTFSVLFVGFANLVLPQISDSSTANLIAGNLSYIGLAFFVMATFYSIVRHRLFDLRLILVRSLAYLLLISVLTIGYVVVTLILSSLLFDDYQVSGNQIVVPVIAMAVLVFTIGPLGRFFNKVTKRFFYKDSYEAQEFLAELNKVVISNVETAILLRNVAKVIDRYLKSYFSTFDLGSNHALQGSFKQAKLDLSKFAKLKDILGRSEEDIIVLDELPQESEVLRDSLEELNIAVAIRLTTPHKDRLGYLFIGQKRSGSAYTAQDIEVIKIAVGELVVAIQNAFRFDEIRRFNATLQEKIDTATKELRQTNQRLRMLDQTKDDFISMASHQLRTPLTSVKGYVSMVLDGDAGKINELQKKLLNQSFLSSQRMVYLISDLLNVSRLRTGKFVIEPIATNLAEVIESEVEQLQETAKGRELTLTYHAPEHFPTLMVDENKLRQVIMNFIDNAIYYTPSGGTITINLVDKPQTIEFTVVDDGIGVPKPEQHHLFSKFYRAHNAKRARPDGTGLGLFMAKKVIIAQGGAVIFKSQEGKGSTFGFTFPKSKVLTKDELPEKDDKKD